MLEARLRKRLQAHNLHTFEDYAAMVFTRHGCTEEMVKLIDAVTTNKTDLFREPEHFDYLVQSALPFMVKCFGVGLKQPLKVWSAGCSTGKEPYTLAMIFKEYQSKMPEFRFDILGTDISTDVLEKAVQGLYAADKAEPIPAALKKRYLLKSKDPAKKQVRIVPELRSMVRFY